MTTGCLAPIAASPLYVLLRALGQPTSGPDGLVLRNHAPGRDGHVGPRKTTVAPDRWEAWWQVASGEV
jgi:hypothetical protein